MRRLSTDPGARFTPTTPGLAVTGGLDAFDDAMRARQTGVAAVTQVVSHWSPYDRDRGVNAAS